MFRASYLAVAVCGLSVFGCGGEPTGTVKGSVTYSGQRVAGAQVLFARDSGEPKEFAGVSGVQGEYYFTYPNVSELPVGKYHVTVTATTIPAGVPLPPGENTENLKAEGKAKAASFAFEKEIVPGDNQVDLELMQGRKVDVPANDS